MSSTYFGADANARAMDGRATPRTFCERNLAETTSANAPPITNTSDGSNALDVTARKPATLAGFVIPEMTRPRPKKRPAKCSLTSSSLLMKSVTPPPSRLASVWRLACTATPAASTFP